VAAGSEKMAWNLFPADVKKRCRQCGKEPLRIIDVAEHRRIYPGGKDEFLCTLCSFENVRKRVKDERERLGLQEQTGQRS